MEDEQLLMEVSLTSYNTLFPRKPGLVINCYDSKMRKHKWNSLCYKWCLFLPKIMENNISVSFFNSYTDIGNLGFVCLHLSLCIRQPKASTFNLLLISKNLSRADVVILKMAALRWKQKTVWNNSTVLYPPLTTHPSQILVLLIQRWMRFTCIMLLTLE